MGRLQVRVLGPFEVDRDGVPVQIPAGKQRALLATLALRPERATSTEEITDRLWGDSPPAAANTTVRGYVKRLRRLLDDRTSASVIRTRERAYQLVISPEDLDAYRFRRLVARSGEAADPAAESSLLWQALELWRAPILCDVDCESLHRHVEPAMRELYIHALSRRIDLDLECRPESVIGELRQLVADDPVQERFWGQLMLALYRSGRQAEALMSYLACQDALAGQLGVDPGIDLRQLHQRILTEDSMLLPLLASVPGDAPPISSLQPVDPPRQLLW